MSLVNGCVQGVGVGAFISRHARTLPFGFGAYRLLICVSGIRCKTLEHPSHMTDHVLKVGHWYTGFFSLEELCLESLVLGVELAIPGSVVQCCLQLDEVVGGLRCVFLWCCINNVPTMFLSLSLGPFVSFLYVHFTKCATSLVWPHSVKDGLLKA